jgi:hypothetical protein
MEIKHKEAGFVNQEMSLEKEKLLALEKEGKYVFHGSAVKIGKLEPRQPEIFNTKEQKTEAHGEPGVSATPFAEVAIFRAIVNKQNFPSIKYASSFGLDRGGSKLIFDASKEVLERLKSGDYKGYVYVLDKESFGKFSSIEWRSGEAAAPIEIIEVSSRDLPIVIGVANWVENR